MNTEATEQEKSQVEEIMARVAEAQGLEKEAAVRQAQRGEERRTARKLLHRYICGGQCDWYQTKSEAAGFHKGGLTEAEKATVQSAVSEVLPGASEEEVWYVVHGVLCPGHPRTRPS